MKSRKEKQRETSDNLPIITLTTDFGGKGPFVGSMKGVILEINPRVRIIDISHEINAFDLLEAAFLISCAYHYFPTGTIHCIVVDPGVGSERRAILAVSKKYTFVAPDNGVLSYIFEKGDIESVVHLKETEFFLEKVSQTFHGRDVFAPVSAWLTKGIDPMCMGPQIRDFVRLDLPKAKLSSDRRQIDGQVIHIDIFGNLLTNISHDLIRDCLEGKKADFRVKVGDIFMEHLSLYNSYDDLEVGGVGAILGSQGYLELFAKQESLSEKWGVHKGAQVKLRVE